MSEARKLWVIGQAVSISLGVWIGLEYSSVLLGVCAAYVIGVLVDIRFEVS